MHVDPGADPWKVEGPAAINFSGGRSSAYMLRRILDAHGGTLPDDVVPVFTNTGRERPETLDFVQRVATEWGVRIRWIEYRYRPEAEGTREDRRHAWVEVSHNSASRDGRPFEELFKTHHLPSPTRRICTRHLKLWTVRRFVSDEFGWPSRYRRVIGIRYDEPRRWGRLLATDCDAIMPMVQTETTRGDVLRYWRRSPFDLELDSHVATGNCDLCYLKRPAALVEIIRREPERADWWVRMEEAKGRTFNSDLSFRDLAAIAARPPDPSLLDAFSADELDDCNCTD